MAVSYKKLFKLLIDREMKKKDLQEAAGLSSSSVTKLAKDEHVMLLIQPGMEALLRNPVAHAVDPDRREDFPVNEGVHCFTAYAQDLHQFLNGIAAPLLWNVPGRVHVLLNLHHFHHCSAP